MEGRYLGYISPLSAQIASTVNKEQCEDSFPVSDSELTSVMNRILAAEAEKGNWMVRVLGSRDLWLYSF